MLQQDLDRISRQADEAFKKKKEAANAGAPNTTDPSKDDYVSPALLPMSGKNPDRAAKPDGKVAFVAFAELSKKIQTGLSKDPGMNIAKKGADAAARGADAAEAALAKHDAQLREMKLLRDELPKGALATA